MKRPVWVTTVGVIGILLGGSGVMGSLNLVVMPRMLQFQKKMLKQMETSIEEAKKRRADAAGKGTREDASLPAPFGGPDEFPGAFFHGFFGEMLDVPPWFAALAAAVGITGAIVSGFYVFASIYLLQMRPHSLAVMYWAFGTGLVMGIARVAAAVSTMSFLTLWMIASGGFGVIVNLVLLAVVLTADKRAFARAGPGRNDIERDAFDA